MVEERQNILIAVPLVFTILRTTATMSSSTIVHKRTKTELLVDAFTILSEAGGEPTKEVYEKLIEKVDEQL